MSTTSTMASRFSDKILDQLHSMHQEQSQRSSPAVKEEGQTSASFMDHLTSGIQAVDTRQKVSDHMASEVAAGKSGDIHETMLAATQAELSFNLMVQVRNKALEAYTEVMRMPV